MRARMASMRGLQRLSRKTSHFKTGSQLYLSTWASDWLLRNAVVMYCVHHGMPRGVLQGDQSGAVSPLEENSAECSAALV